MTPDPIWDRRLWTMLGVARDFAGDREGAFAAWKRSIVGHEHEGPLSMTEARGFLACAAYLHEDRNDEDAGAVARRGDYFLAQFAKTSHGRAGLNFSGELRRRVAQSMRQDDVAEDFARRDASGDVLAEGHIKAAKAAESEKRLDDAERLYLRALDCAPWSTETANQVLAFLLRHRRAKTMARLGDEARVAGHSSFALFSGGLVALGARDGDGAVARLGRLALTGVAAPRPPRYPLGLGFMLVHEPGIALRVLFGDPGWTGGGWEMDAQRRASALKWVAKAQLAMGEPQKALRLLRRTEAGGMSLAAVQEIEWEAAYLRGKVKEALRHVGLVIDRPEEQAKSVAQRFRAVVLMEKGQWEGALADWESALTEDSDAVSVLAAWLCARAAGKTEAMARWSKRSAELKSRWTPFMAGQEDAAAMQRVLARASLGGETQLAWEFFLLGVARLQEGDKAAAAQCLRQSIARARDEVVVRVAAQRLLSR